MVLVDYIGIFLHFRMCVNGTDLASVSTIYQLDIGTVPAVWYFFSILLPTNLF